MTKKEEYIRTMQAKLDIWNYDIDTMSAKADKASSHSMLDYTKQIELLRAMQAVAREKIKKLEEAGDNLWEDSKPDIRRTWGDMGELIDSARHHFR